MTNSEKLEFFDRLEKILDRIDEKTCLETRNCPGAPEGEPLYLDICSFCMETVGIIGTESACPCKELGWEKAKKRGMEALADVGKWLDQDE